MYKRASVLKFALILVPILWLCIIGLRLWHFAHLETDPPVFDALSYVQKAQAFWEAVGRGKYFNPLKVEPNIRPFGVVFVTYPLGFHGGFRSFYFLSVFLPLLITYLAIWNVFRPFSNKTILQVLAFCIACLAVVAMPAAYQLDHLEGVNVMGVWGFVDLIFGAISALGISFIVRSRFEPTIGNALWSSTIAVFTVLVKPAGITIMAIMFGSSLAIAAWQFLKEEVDKRYVLKVLGIYLTWYLVCAIALHHSAYFSRENIAYGESSLRLLHEIQKQNGLSIIAALSKIWVTYGLGVLVLLAFAFARSFDSKWWILSALAACTIAGGTWLWIGRTNVELVRYFFPFLLMAFIFLLPPLLLKPNRRMILCVLGCLVVLPNIFIGFCLFNPDRFVSAQKALGLSLGVNLNGDVVRAAEGLRDEIKDQHRSYIVYYCGEAPVVHAFESVLDWSRLLGFEGGNTVPALPIDWVHEPAYRLDLMLRSDYIVFQPNDDFKSYLATHLKADDFSSEEWLIRSWLSSLSGMDGVERVYSGRVVLLHVKNSVALLKSASSLVAAHQWRDVFLDGFSSFRTAYLRDSGQSITGNLLKEPINLYYGKQIVATAYAFAHEHDGGQDVLKLYLRQIKPLPNFDSAYWTVFVHDILKDGREQGGYASYLNGVSEANEVVIYRIVLKSATTPIEPRKFAFGVYSQLPNGKALSLINPGADWDGRRTVVTEP